MRQIERNSFARATLVKDPVHLDEITGPTCSWCGNAGKVTQSGRTLYHIGWIGDTGRQGFKTKLYCSVSCYRTYNI